MLAVLLSLPGRVKTILDRLTSTRAANLDKLDVNISTRAAASSALSNAVWTDAKAVLLDNLSNIAAPPDRLKSRAHYEVVVSGTGAVSSFQTIPSVFTTKTRLIFLGCWSPSGGTCSGGIKLAGATSVACFGNTSSSGMTWSFTVEEYY